MAGILSALGSTLNVLEVFSDSDGTAKGIVKALRGKKMRMIRADGSMLKFINKYIVEPVIVIDSKLRNLEELDSIIALHVDMFSGFYMQTFEVMTNVEGVSANTVIDTLATDNGGLTRALLSGAELAMESRDFASEFMFGDSINLSTEAKRPKRSSVRLNKTQKRIRDANLRRAMMSRDVNGNAYIEHLKSHHKMDQIDYEKVKEIEDIIEKGQNSEYLRNLSEIEKQKKIATIEAEIEVFNSPQAKEMRKTMSDDEYKDWEKKKIKELNLQKDQEELRHERDRKEKDKDIETLHQQALQRDRLNKTMEGSKAGLGRGAKELFIPEAVIRNIELTITTEITQGKNKGREIIMNIPITIKANILFTSAENIGNAIQSSGDEFRFGYRWDEYRSGAISLGDFIFASDLIKKYKSNRLKDKNSLMELINARSLSANSKMIDNGFAGFEKYYNMVILDESSLPAIERQLRGKIKDHKYKERFLEYIQGLSVSVVDTDYERLFIGLKDIRGTTDITFKTAVKTEKKGGADVSEIVKALMANRSPVF